MSGPIEEKLESAEAVPVQPRPKASAGPKQRRQKGEKPAVRRGSVLHIDGKPVCVTRIGGDGSIPGDTTIHYARVNEDGTLQGENWIHPWDLDGRMRQGTAGYIDGGHARTVVALPAKWQEQARTLREMTERERAARLDAVNEKEPVTHPSFGCLTLVRASGSQRLFGTPFRHHTMISITLHRAVEHRSLSRTWHSTVGAGPAIAEIRMSEAQFARFITSASVGEGVPCTLAEVEGERMPLVPETNEVEEFHHDAKRALASAGRKITEAIDKVKALLAKPNLAKRDREELLSLLRSVGMAFTDSVPFTLEQFGARMEKIVEEGRIEIEAAAEGAALRLGLPVESVRPVKLLTERETTDEKGRQA